MQVKCKLRRRRCTDNKMAEVRESAVKSAFLVPASVSSCPVSKAGGKGGGGDAVKLNDSCLLSTVRRIVATFVYDDSIAAVQRFCVSFFLTRALKELSKSVTKHHRRRGEEGVEGEEASLATEPMLPRSFICSCKPKCQRRRRRHITLYLRSFFSLFFPHHPICRILPNTSLRVFSLQLFPPVLAHFLSILLQFFIVIIRTSLLFCKLFNKFNLFK